MSLNCINLLFLSRGIARCLAMPRGEVTVSSFTCNWPLGGALQCITDGYNNLFTKSNQFMHRYRIIDFTGLNNGDHLAGIADVG